MSREIVVAMTASNTCMISVKENGRDCRGGTWAMTGQCLRTGVAFSCAAAFLVLAAALLFAGNAARGAEAQSTVDTAYPNMPQIAPIGVRIGHHLPIPEDAKGPPIDRTKG